MENQALTDTPAVASQRASGGSQEALDRAYAEGLREPEKHALRLMRDGYALVVGRGLFHFQCSLVKGVDRLSLARSYYKVLREERLVKYTADDSSIATLTKRGARIADHL